MCKWTDGYAYYFSFFLWDRVLLLFSYDLYLRALFMIHSLVTVKMMVMAFTVDLKQVEGKLMLSL